MNNSELVKETKALMRIDRECVDLFREKTKPSTNEEHLEYYTELTELCYKGVSIWKKIKMHLGNVSVVNHPDRKTREILKRIRNDKYFFVIKLQEIFVRHANINIENPLERYPVSTEDFVREDLNDFLEEFHSNFDIVDYFYKKIQVGCVLMDHKSDQAVDRYYDEIRECYAFGQYRACAGLSRALIELVLHEALRQKGKLGSRGAIEIGSGREERFYLGRLIADAARQGILSNSEKRSALAVKNQAEKILHFRDRSQDGEMSLTSTDAYDLIRDTISVIEAVLPD